MRNAAGIKSGAVDKRLIFCYFNQALNAGAVSGANSCPPVEKK
jgi:hypothetical protein